MSEEEGGEKTETAVDLYREAPIMTRDHGNTMTMSEFAGWMEDNLGTDFQSALQQAAFMLCGDVISQDIAKSTLRLHRRTGSKTSEVVMPKEHPTAALLALEPNRRHTWMEYTEMMVYWGIVVSNAYAYVERDRVGNPIELIPLQSPRVEEKIEGRDVFYDIIASTEQERALLGATMLTAPERNMIHVRSRMLDGMNGYSTLSAGTNTLKAGKALDKFRENLFDGDGSLRGVFVRDTPSEMSEPAFQRLKSEFRSLMRNFRKLTEPIVLEGDFKFESISSNPKEMELTEQFTAQIKATCRLLRVPPYKVFEMEGEKYCLPASEKVLTEFGPISIAEVMPGDRVWSRAEGGKAVLSTVKNSVSSGVDRILKISTKQRTLRLNARHRVLARRKTKWIEQIRLGGGRCLNQRRVTWSTEYVPASELRVGDIIIGVGGTPDTGIDRTPTRRASIPFMEVLGFYTGDGYIRSRDGNPHSVSLARHIDAPYMDAYRASVRDLFCKTSRQKGSCDSLVPVHLQEPPNATIISSATMAREIIELGVTGNAHTKRVPGWVFALSDDLKLAFLRGYLDSDGTVNKKGRIRFFACQRPLIEDIWHLCVSLGIPVTNIAHTKQTARLPQGAGFDQEAWQFTCSDPKSNLRIGSHTPEYIVRMEAGQPFKSTEGKFPKRGGAGFDEEDFIMTRISSIEEDGEEEVFDLQVDGTESFFASGVVVHNSNLETGEKMYVGDSLIPTCKLHEERMAKVLLSKEDRLEYFFEYDREEMTLRDPARETERVIKAMERGAITFDEGRAKLGWNPLPNGQGNARMVPTNMTVVDESGNVLIPGSSTAGSGGDQNSSKSADELTDQTDDENSAQVLRLVANDER